MKPNSSIPYAAALAISAAALLAGTANPARAGLGADGLAGKLIVAGALRAAPSTLLPGHAAAKDAAYGTLPATAGPAATSPG